MKEPLIILAGPTAVGKTGLSVKLAKAAGCEIISADSMQVYRHMDIGSAKIRPEEMEGVPHHLIDCLDVDEEFNVVRFQQMARAAIKEIQGRGKIPLLVGGTGFYIQAVAWDIDFEEIPRTIPSAGVWRKWPDARGQKRCIRCWPRGILPPRKPFTQQCEAGDPGAGIL